MPRRRYSAKTHLPWTSASSSTSRKMSGNHARAMRHQAGFFEDFEVGDRLELFNIVTIDHSQTTNLLINRYVKTICPTLESHESTNCSAKGWATFSDARLPRSRNARHRHEVDTAPNLRNATVYVSVYGGESASGSSSSSSEAFRNQAALASKVILKYTPILHFSSARLPPRRSGDVNHQ